MFQIDTYFLDIGLNNILNHNFRFVRNTQFLFEQLVDAQIDDILIADHSAFETLLERMFCCGHIIHSFFVLPKRDFIEVLKGCLWQRTIIIILL